MLTIFGKSQRYCDGVSRRSFLKIGALGIGAGALSLSDVFRHDALAATSSRHKAVIHIYLGGGPPHQDMWEIKTDAPVEIRGEFKPIATNVPGIQIGEVFGRIASRMDKFAVIRSVAGCIDRHDPVQCLTGWPFGSLKELGGRPSIGAAVAKLQGPVDASVPAFVGLAKRTQHLPWSDHGQSGFVGPSFGAFHPDGDGLANMKLNGITIDQLGDRKRLLTSFDTLRRDIDTSRELEAVDTYTEKAFDVLTSSKLVDALDLSKEDSRVRESYGDGTPYKFQFDGAPTATDQFLIARRLVEAGARVVTLTFGRWDSHGDNFGLVRDHGAKLDKGLSALVDDLESRGMLNDVTVIAWGEFGRTPKINKGGGRDHWPQVSCAILAGGGMRTGQAIGSTNRYGEVPKDRPVHVQEVLATLYHNLGIDTSSTTLLDPAGRPQYLVERPAISELI